MDFKSQADTIHKFLSRYQKIWQAEVLDGYPKSLENYPSDWLDTMWKLSFDELYRFDSKEAVSAIKGTNLETFIKEVQELSCVPKNIDETDVQLEDWAWTDVKFKKKHEIERMAPVLKKLQTKLNFKKIVDIGGGVGHFSRILAHYYQIECISIDREKSFQESGKKRINRYRKLSNAKNIQFENINFGAKEDEDKLQSIIDHESFSVGLHTCGSLANTIIYSTLKFRGNGLLSFGCCYHKLHYNKDFPISSYYQNTYNLALNVYAFTLATRAHGAISKNDFETKWRVKNYRGALHLFLYHRLNIYNCLDVGELKNVKEYYLPFSHYIRSKLQQLNIEHHFSDLDFDNFFNDLETQNILKKMFLASMIRWQIGRVLELYLLIDRAIYLIENNYHVNLNTYFDENISPRNLGILAFKN